MLWRGGGILHDLQNSRTVFSFGLNLFKLMGKSLFSVVGIEMKNLDFSSRKVTSSYTKGKPAPFLHEKTRSNCIAIPIKRLMAPAMNCLCVC